MARPHLRQRHCHGQKGALGEIACRHQPHTAELRTQRRARTHARTRTQTHTYTQVLPETAFNSALGQVQELNGCLLVAGGYSHNGTDFQYLDSIWRPSP